MDFDNPRSEFERLFAEFVRRPRGGHFQPNVDVILDEDVKQLIVKVEIAGADAESLRVFADERHLFISGRRVEAAREYRGSFLQKEIEYGEFAKKIHLPVAVQYGEVTATYGDGILTIALPIAQTEYIPTTRTEIRMIVKRILA